MKANVITYQPANAKLAKLAASLAAKLGRRAHIYGISLPAGWSCPAAKDCKSKADRKTGKITDGPDTQFRCFMASIEAFSRTARESAWRNFDALRTAKTLDGMLALLQAGLPKNADVVRIDVDGDFFNQTYFDACLQLARNNPRVAFYAYTKSLNYLVNRLGTIPDNLNITASRGGHLDHLIDAHGLKSATVVFHPDEAAALGLEIDHDETHALYGKSNFALLIHGTQPKGTNAASAIKTLKAEDIDFTYGKLVFPSIA